jgi:hypothetical protein
MAVFVLKANDTRPILEVALLNPDGTPHDLTGATEWKLHIRLSNGSTLTRDLVKQGLDTAGVLRYTWLATDWAPTEPTDPKLPVPRSPYHALELPMEYEIVSGSSRLTFPNDGRDTLRILGEVA